MTKRKPVRKKKNGSAPSRTSPTRAHSIGTQVLGRVRPDLCVLTWGYSPDDIRHAAESVSKSIEVMYQLDLLSQSGLGSGDDDDGL